MISKLMWPLLAAAVTAGLFLLMSYLITPSSKIPTTDVEEVSVDITRRPRDETSKSPPLPPAKKPKEENLPPPPPIVLAPLNPNENSNPYITVIPPIKGGKLPTGNGTGDRHATPIVRIPPQYPPNALARGIEGWVLVEFTINAGGTVENIVVINGEPKGVFDRAAKRALKRWKYQPKIIDGRATAQLNMREIFRFEIGDEK